MLESVIDVEPPLHEPSLPTVQPPAVTLPTNATPCGSSSPPPPVFFGRPMPENQPWCVAFARSTPSVIEPPAGGDTMPVARFEAVQPSPYAGFFCIRCGMGSAMILSAVGEPGAPPSRVTANGVRPLPSPGLPK
jgi:hypothetical protein